MSDGPIIRLARPDDAPRLAEIHICGWRGAYRGIIDDAILFARMSVVRRAETFRASLEGGERTYLVEEGGIIKGFMTHGPSRDDDKIGAWELWGIYVDPFMKREGIGSRLEAFCVETAAREAYREIVLWVFEANSESRRFYQARGYAEDGARKELESYGAYAVRYRKAIDR
jgi:GNAT superfamily N-acetyltransferase